MIPIATLFLGFWGCALLILERRFPAVPWPVDKGRFVRNLALGAIVFAASPFIQMATVKMMPGALPLVALGSGWAVIVFHILVLDLWAYLLHRAYHRVPLLWRLHAPHHFDAHLDVTSAVRFHLGEVLLSSVLRLIPLWALGISLETNLLYGTILAASAMFHHSNLRLPTALERALSKVIVTPSIHWVHHHAVQRDTDSNYASILSVWDHLFRSASPTRRWPTMPIGVEGDHERSLGRLIAYPLVETPK